MQFAIAPYDVWLTPIAWVFLAYIGVVLPLAALRQHRLAAAAPAGAQVPSRLRIYVSAFVTHFAFVAVVFATMGGRTAEFVSPVALSPTVVLIGVAALTVGLLPLLPQFQFDNPIGKARTKLIAPRTPAEHAAYYALCASAGFAEELAYRGLLFSLLGRLIGSWWLAAIAASAIFGVVHLFQGWKSAVGAGLMGLREHLVLGLTGSLLPGMIVHFLHNVVVGTVVSARVRRAEAA